MKATFLALIVVITVVFGPSAAAQTADLNGTWSGSWTPKGGVRDALTVEFRKDRLGHLTGKFLTPVVMEFSKASFNAQTAMVSGEAADTKSGKHYKLDGKVRGTEIKGTLLVNDVSGEMLLIKWTYVPR